MLSEKILLILGCLLHVQTALAIWGCTLDSECQTLRGSVCQGGLCVCPHGKQSVLGGSLCADVSPYHFSSCMEDFQCSRLFTTFECRRPENSTINEDPGNCACASGNHYFRGRCWPNRTVGETCTRQEECRGVLNDPFAMSCTDGVCGCSDGYVLRQRGECRKISNEIGDRCVIDQDCQFPGGVCERTTAAPFTLRCVYREVPEEPPVDPEEPPVDPEEPPVDPEEPPVDPEEPPVDPEEPPVDPEEPPVDPEEPPVDPEEPPVNPIERVGSRNLPYGAACTATEPCADPFECSSLGMCHCPLGYYSNAARTICLAELGSPVTTANQCVGAFTEVRDGICTCWNNFYFNEDMRTCVKATHRITDACVSDENCHTFGIHARCSEPGDFELRNCECDLNETVWDSNRNMCRVFAGISEICEVDSDCIAGELEIQCVPDDEGVRRCACPPGYTTHEGLCLSLGQSLGDTCQISMECSDTENSECINSVCSCASGYQQVDDICAPTIGGTCEVDNDCVIENTWCSTGNKICSCQYGFVEYNDVCYPVSYGYDAPCNVSEQCHTLGDGAVCVNGNCTCDDDYHFRDEGCWPRTALFSTCRRGSECFLWQNSEMVECRNSICQCNFDNPYSEELGTCRSSAGSLVRNYITMALAIFYLFSR